MGALRALQVGASAPDDVDHVGVHRRHDHRGPRVRGFVTHYRRDEIEAPRFDLARPLERNSFFFEE